MECDFSLVYCDYLIDTITSRISASSILAISTRFSKEGCTLFEDHLKTVFSDFPIAQLAIFPSVAFQPIWTLVDLLQQ